ncbi:MAG: hypothetical protein WC373_12710 [Smithella sp.]
MEITEAELKAKIKEAAEAAVADATAGLVAKNQELLGKLKKATKDAAIDPAEYQALQTELEATQAKLATAEKSLKAAQMEAEKTKKALEAESGFTSKLLIENGLNETLIKAGVKPEMTKAVKALLAGQVTLKVEGDKRTPVIGDKSLGDFVGEWAKSDEGKHFVAAPNNGGGGAHGGANDKGGAKTMTRAAFEALDAAGKMDFTKEGGTLIAG